MLNIPPYFKSYKPTFRTHIRSHSHTIVYYAVCI